MEDLTACPGAGILGAATRLKIDKKRKCLDALRHHINRPFQTMYIQVVEFFEVTD
jgi:hypothetical protein